MPKKTKKQKIMAKHHRQAKLMQAKTIQSHKVIEIKTSKVTTPETANAADSVETTELKMTNMYFFSDLKKSMILVIITIALEFALYFAKLIR